MGEPSPQWIALVTEQIRAQSLDERVRLAQLPDVYGSVAQRVVVEESDWRVAEVVAANPTTDPAVLRWLAFRNDGSGGRVQRALVSNPALDEGVKQRLRDL